MPARRFRKSTTPNTGAWTEEQVALDDYDETSRIPNLTNIFHKRCLSFTSEAQSRLDGWMRVVESISSGWSGRCPTKPLSMTETKISRKFYAVSFTTFSASYHTWTWWHWTLPQQTNAG